MIVFIEHRVEPHAQSREAVGRLQKPELEIDGGSVRVAGVLMDMAFPLGKVSRISLAGSPLRRCRGTESSPCAPRRQQANATLLLYNCASRSLASALV